MRLEALFQPRSIAVIGASEKPTVGRRMVASLDRIGFAGAIYPVNPTYPTILGHPCYPSIADVPEAPDVAVFCLGHQRVLDAFIAAARRGIKGAVIYDGGFAEQGEEGRRLQDGILAICREAGIALCGPNCMGVLNPHHPSTTYLGELRDPTGLAGNVGLVSQSGAVCISLLTDIRRFGFSHVVSSGNEAVLCAADYLEYLVEDPHTAVIGLFIETIREPDRFVAALDRAAAAGKPVVVLKVGPGERARRAVPTHTGGTAGEPAAVSALLRAHRAIEVVGPGRNDRGAGGLPERETARRAAHRGRHLVRRTGRADPGRGRGGRPVGAAAFRGGARRYRQSDRADHRRRQSARCLGQRHLHRQPAASAEPVRRQPGS